MTRVALTIIAVALSAFPAWAQSISKQGFNSNVPACPVDTATTINTDKFSDGTPLPSCGGRRTNGNQITTFKMVWTGAAWAKYPPSIQTVTIAPRVAPVLPPPPAAVARPPAASPAPPGISRQGFNFNVQACPVDTPNTISLDKFSDGTPLPSCGGRQTNGNQITTYKMVWTGFTWAKYLPSVQTVTVAPPSAPAPRAPPVAVTRPPAAPAQTAAPGISKQGFNNNVPACPVDTANTINLDKFSDGTPLPSCGGRRTNGNQITTFKMVWTGQAWAKYLPSVQTVTVAPPSVPAPHAPPVAVTRPPAAAPGISKQGFNNNVPACPVDTANTINLDKFSDGTPLPSCGGRQTNGNQITTYKMVWTGQAWAKYLPSVQTVTVAAAPVPPGKCAIPQITAALIATGRDQSVGSGNTGVCDPLRYRGGSWNQPDLIQIVARSFFCDGTTPDQPWIGEAYAELNLGLPRRMRAPNGTSTVIRYTLDECDLKLYGGGTSGYNDLKAKIASYRQRLAAAGTPVPDGPVPGTAGGVAGGGAGGGGAGGGGAGGQTPTSTSDPFAGAPAQLDALTNLQDAVTEGTELITNLQSLYDALEPYSSGPDALFDPQVIQTGRAAVNFLQYLINGSNNPDSLQRLATGTAVAFNKEELRILDEMFARTDFPALFRSANATLIEAVRQVDPRAIQTVGPSGPVRYAQLGGPALIRMSEVHQRINMSGLDRAQGLATLLNYGRLQKDANIMANYIVNWDDYAATAASVTIRLYGQRATAAAAKANDVAKAAIVAEEVVKVGGVIKAWSEYRLIAQFAVIAFNAIVAVTPVTISRFYMTIDNTEYRANLPAHPMDVGATAVSQIFVVPKSPGGTILTPVGVINSLVTAGMAPSVSEAFTKLLEGGPILVRVRASLDALIHTLSKSHINAGATFFAGSWALANWATSGEMTIKIAPYAHRPVEIDDARVVKLSAGPVGAEHVSISQRPDRRYTITAVSPGTTGISGQIQPEMATLYTNGGEEFLRMAIQVNDPAPAAPPASTLCAMADGESGTISPITHQCVMGN